MRNAVLVSACLATLVASAAAQSPVTGNSQADTVWIVIHHVASGGRPEYEQWMKEVWGKTAAKIAAQDREFSAAMASRQRFVPTRAERDGSWTYVSIYHTFPAPGGKSGGLRAVFAAAGWAEAKIEAELEKMKAIILRSEASPMLEQNSGPTGDARPARSPH